MRLLYSEDRSVRFWTLVFCDPKYTIMQCSAIGKHLRDAHNQKDKDLREQFTILKKCVFDLN